MDEQGRDGHSHEDGQGPVARGEGERHQLGALLVAEGLGLL